jgi:hypothetical protein
MLIMKIKNVYMFLGHSVHLKAVKSFIFDVQNIQLRY